jgi:hypothetical protein
MPYLLAGFLIIWFALYAAKAFARADPRQLARLLEKGGAALLFAFALFFLLRGRIEMTIGCGALGAWLLAMSRRTSHGAFRSGSRGHKVSRVRSAMVEMELDLETGAMRGTILAGPDEGRALEDLTRPQCERVYRLCLRDDPDGARLLEAYLDRRFPGWRSTRQSERDAGMGGAQRPRRMGAMSEDEAYEVLGLQKGASRDDVVRSHRSLMQKFHPDHGGSTDLAARVNEAKDVLMRRHL